jgi:hypothetical protein
MVPLASEGGVMDKTQFDRMLDNVKWDYLATIPDHADDLPYATHEGVLDIAPGLKITVYRLNTGQRIITEEGLQTFLRWLSGEEA